MNNTTARTELSAVKAAQTFQLSRDLLFANPYTSQKLLKIIELLEGADVVKALNILESARHLFAMRFEEIKKENAK